MNTRWLRGKKVHGKQKVNYRLLSAKGDVSRVRIGKVTANGIRVSFGGNVLILVVVTDAQFWIYTTIELYTLNEGIVWSMNYISTKLLEI